MKRWILTPVAILAIATSAHADESGRKLGLGFHGTDAPIGARWRVSDRVAVDAGVGFGSTVIGSDHAQRVSANVGVLFPLAHWDRVQFALRPGFTYSSEEAPQVILPGGDHLRRQHLTPALEIETEVFLLDRVSVSGSFGVAYDVLRIPGNPQPDTKTFTTTGGNFTDVGFHVYFGGTQ